MAGCSGAERRPYRAPRQHRLAIALAGSLLLHLAFVAYTLLAPRPAVPARPPASVQFEIVSEARPPAAKKRAPPPVTPKAPDRKKVAAAVRRQVAATPQAKAVEPRSPALTPEPEKLAAQESPAVVSDLPRRAPEIADRDLAPIGIAIERAFTSPEGTGSKGSSRPPVESKEQVAAAVKQQVETMFGDTVREHRLASVGVDSAVVDLGRSFERAGRANETNGLTESWIKKAFAAYFAELQHSSSPRFSAPHSGGRDAAWEDQLAAARAMLGRSGATYAALIEVRQGADGKLVDLKLLASSGAHVFDARALGSVVEGIAASPFASDQGGLGPGRLSLWELTGERISDSKAVRGAQAAYRYALLDVVPLKETIIELDRGGKTEQMKYAARLIAVY